MQEGLGTALNMRGVAACCLKKVSVFLNFCKLWLRSSLSHQKLAGKKFLCTIQFCTVWQETTLLIPRPSRHCFCILQAVKYWSQEWPGNEATLQPSLSYLVWERDQFPLQASHAEVKRSWYEATLHTHTYMYIHGLLWVYPWPSQAVPCQQWLWHRPHPTSESSPHGHSDNPEGSIYTPFKVCGGEC